MGIPITVRRVDAAGKGSSVDVALQSIQHTTIAEIANLVSPVVDASPDLPVAVDGVPVSRESDAVASGVRAGARVTLGVAGGARSLPVVGHQLRVIGGSDAGAVINLTRGNVRIGRSASADLTLGDPEASRLHADIRVTDVGIWLRDLGSCNGTRIGCRTIRSVEEPLPLETTFRIGNTSLRISSVREPPAAVTEQSGTKFVHASRRRRRDAPTSVVFPEKAASSHRPSIGLVAALVPTAVSVGIAAAFHNPQLLAFAALTPIMMLSTSASDRWSARRQRREKRANYQAALSVAERALADAAAAEEEALHRDFPDAAALSETVRTADIRLFERVGDDPEFLLVRLGLADRPSRCHGTRSGAEVARPTLTAVPATVSIRDGAIGIAGPQDLVRGSARWLIVQLATLQSPSDVHLYLLGASAEWRWLRWLPGLQGAAESSDDMAGMLADILAEYDRRVAQSSTSPAGASPRDPWLVVVVDRPRAGGLLSSVGTLVADGWRVGISFVILVERATRIPPACRTRVVYDADDPALLSVHAPDQALPEVVADRISGETAEQFTRRLAPMLVADRRPASSGQPVERLLELFELTAMTPEQLAARWAGQSPLATALTVGTTTAGRFEMDLAVDGPHVLIAGSTGSGKSELLRALVVSLALSQPPDRLSMVLIDYKGGAAFAGFSRLPHASAVITDLEPATTRRALLSIGAELRRREAAFARAGASDLAGYLATPEAQRDPIGRLVLVVDEFASLAEELPGFLDGLLAIAQRGRSLGVHLVLATQRPAGAISAGMRANMPLRIALRVTEPAESLDVIGVAAAAHIAKNRPGRGFAVLSGGLVEFQAARVDLPAPPDGPSVQILDAWNRPVRSARPADAETSPDSDLSVICRTAQQAASQQHLTPVAAPWLPPLPHRVTLTDLPTETDIGDGGSRIAFGLVDDPSRQRQFPATHDLSAGGAIAFIGSAQSGRTTAMRTFVAAAATSLAPDDLHCHVLDCASGALAGITSLPHCGSVLAKFDPPSVLRLIELLSSEVASRQQQITRIGASSAREAARLGLRLPLMILVVDGWDEFAELSEEYDAGRSLAAMLAIMRDSAAVGLTVLVAGERGLFGVRVSSHLSRRFVFRLNERGDYGIAGIPLSAVPRSWPPGRALTAEEALEVQFALLDRDPSTVAQDARLDGIAASSEPADRWPPMRLRPLPTMCPPSLPLVAGNQALLGLGGDEANPVAIDICQSTRLLVTGPAGSGRTTTLLRMAAGAEKLGHGLIVVAETGSPLADWAVPHEVPLYGPHAVADIALLVGAIEEPAPFLVIDHTAPLDDPNLSDALGALVVSYQGAIAVAVRSEQLLMSFRGPVPELLRSRTGVLLRPSNTDRDAFGLRTGRPPAAAVPGRGVLVTNSTRQLHPDGLPIQVAMP